jgi:transcriptional regulator with XRE-family HTH domain
MNVTKKHALLYGKLAEQSMTQKQLADKLSISSATLSAKLTGKSEFNVREIYKISEVLGISKENIVSYFFG